MGLGNGTPTGIAYNVCDRSEVRGLTFRDRSAVFDPAQPSRVAVADAVDIQNLEAFTIATWTFCKSTGAGGNGKFLSKENGLRFEVTNLSGSWVGLYGKVTYGTTSAESLSNYPLKLGEWHHVAFTFDKSGDAKIHIYVDGLEVSSYNYQIAAVGSRTSDVGQTLYIGNTLSAARCFDGEFSDFVILNIPWEYPARTALVSTPKFTRDFGCSISLHEHWRTLSPVHCPNGCAIFQFDDAYAGVYTHAFPTFENRGQKMNVAVPTNYIDQPGRLSAHDIEFMHMAGHCILSHSVSHADMMNMSDASMIDEFADSQVILEAICQAPVRHFAWPYSCVGERGRQICAEYYDSASDGGRSRIPLFNSYAIGHLTIDDPGGIASYYAALDEIKAAHAPLILLMHDVDAADATTLDLLIQYCVAQAIPIATRQTLLSVSPPIVPYGLNGQASLRLDNTLNAYSQSFGYAAFSMPAGQSAIASFLAFRPDANPIDSSVIFPYVSGGIHQDAPYYTKLASGLYFVQRRVHNDLGAPATVRNLIRITPGFLVYTSTPTWTPLS